MKTLSIIVPVYRAEKYLDACLTSLMSDRDCIREVILVDDCSDDGSGALCDFWAAKDGRISVLHLSQNGGLSKARNIGIETARGDYLAFVDADDTVQSGTFSACMKLIAEHPDAEVVEFPVWVHYGASNAYLYCPGTETERQTYDVWIRRRGFLHSYAWNKVYHRRLWTAFRFPEGRKFEDMFTIPYVLQQTDSIYVQPDGLYYYYSHAQSITQTASAPEQADLFDANIRFFTYMHRQLHRPHMELDRYYLHLYNMQIVYGQLGGGWKLPVWHLSPLFPFRSGLSPMERLKSLCCLFSARLSAFFAINIRKCFR